VSYANKLNYLLSYLFTGHFLCEHLRSAAVAPGQSMRMRIVAYNNDTDDDDNDNNNEPGPRFTKNLKIMLSSSQDRLQFISNVS